MRVLLVNYEFPPLGGGASTASWLLACQLVRIGCGVDVLTARHGVQAAVEEKDGVRIFRVSSWRRGVHDVGYRGALCFLLFGSGELRRLLQSHQYDVVHYFFGLPTGLLALTCPEAREVPYIVSLRGSDVPGYDLENWSLRLLHRLLMPLTRRIWSRASAVVANSHDLGRLAEKASPSTAIEVVHNGMEAQTERLPVFRGGLGDPMRLVCVARLVRRKGIDHLIRAVAAAAAVTRVELDLVGTGKDGTWLRGLARRLGVGDRVHFLGYRGGADLGAVYERGDVFVLPSLSESCSMSLLEAMAHGLAVIATRVGGTPEVVVEPKNGLLACPGSTTELAVQIQSMEENPRWRAEVGRANLARVSEHFSLQRVVEGYVSVYEQVANVRRPVPSSLYIARVSP